MMRERVLSNSIRLLCLSGFALTVHTAFAQEAPATPDAIQTVQVTGSRIRSPNADSPSPLQILNAADIAASGATNLQDLLQKNPTMGTPTSSRTNSNFQTSGGGITTVNLRNMGDSRTLVLVNGRRFVSGVAGDTAVDLNTIPTDFIERVELLTGGASATYGSDAVAGVINIILKRNFNGMTIDAQGGRSSRHDDEKRKLGLTWGTTSADGNSNIMAHFGYTKQGAVMSKDRDFSAVDQFSKMAGDTGEAADAFVPIRPFYSSFTPQGTFIYGTRGADRFTYDRNGNIIPVSTNGSATQAPTGYNRSDFRSIAVPTERYLFATTGNFAFNQDHSAFFEGTYAQTRNSTNIEPFALNSLDIYKASSGQVPAEFLVNGAMVRNPLVPQYLYDRIKDTDGDGARDYSFTRRLAEVGSRHSDADRGTFRLATGLKGTVSNWNYEAFISYGKTKESQVSTGQVNVMNFRNALEAIPGGINGIQCRDANARAQGCVPINVFGRDTISPEALKYVTAPGSLDNSIVQKLAGASINGDLYQLPAGALSVALGWEYRREESSSIADPLTQSGLNAGNAIPPTFGKYDVREAYVEARVPLLKDAPFAKQLSLLTAYRHGNYSSVGGTNSWNAGFEWAPTNDIKFRGTKAVSTRAPNISELYQPPSQNFPSVNDPCEGVTATSTGKYDAACRAAPGVAANIAANGEFTLTQADIQGVSGYDRGNPNLKAEKGKSTTVGVILTPRSIPVLSKFTFTADYFKINIEDAIFGTPRQYSIDQCYSGTNPAFCSYITRWATAAGNTSAGAIRYVDTTQLNSGGLGTKGVDLTASWSDRVGPGRLNAHLAYTYVKTLWNKPMPDADVDENVGEVSEFIGSSTPKHKAVLNLAYKWGDWGISTTTTYNGKVSLDDQFLKGFELPPRSIGIGSKTYNDFQLTYALKKSTELYLGVDNAFDVKPPPIISGLPGNVTGTETDASVYDPIGRRYYFGVRVSL
ncbi:TonB-dependent receptor plug domain-containing protein [Pseudoduganella ginsengisoli]|uniref:TonB-dependent receptor n=1 Tax=Pseudoduganella ginsengisoli TaxID=1462440 RepID=A0A6L6Q5Y4_9BURK|nr:TonB-dependent receptor [Pseudoduganella ginsengisoli]MTW04926.1 TonB-dependent receptor [Pseudoduganella ginsengisoli]